MSPSPETLSPAASPVVLDAAELERFPDLERLIARISSARREPVAAGNLWGSSQALVLAALVARAQGPWVAVTSSDAEAEGLLADLETFGASGVALPAREAPVGARSFGVDADNVRQRLLVAQRLGGPAERRPRLVVASLLSLLQPIPSQRELERDFLTLQQGGTLDAEALLERLVSTGYARQPLAEKPGEVSLRGEILDVYPLASELPLRIELFGDEIESLRTFDPVDQRSVETLERVQVCLATDSGGIEDGSGVAAFSMLAPTAVWVRVEPLRIADASDGLRIRSASHARALHELGRWLEDHRQLDLQSLPASTVDFETRSIQSLAVGMREAAPALRAAAGEARVIVLCRTEGEQHRLDALLAQDGPVPSGLQTRVGSVSKGFRLPALALVVVNHREIAGIEGLRRAAPKRAVHRVRALQSFFELKIGDIVVHAVHGVARFAGLVRMRRGTGEEEHLHLQFADEVSLYVPGARIDVVQRYIGTGSASPPLDKIGSQSFRKRKERVERALYDLAAELLEVQARRAAKTRAAWVPAGEEDELVRDMVGSFPWQDTVDQVTVDAEIVTDLRSERAMDRLLCGDVGFGKTELAVRAAYRVVHGGGQVAVLVPTTLLAQQHYDTFRERLADFPVEVGLLSRYVTPGHAKQTLEGLAQGRVDVVVGTHRLLSKDVTFKRLGLVVVDEEQRFGVVHKEHFKKLRATVDLLTMTATPIPRTLHMSMSGLRDISALTVPPPGRQEIETRLVDSEDDALLREVILDEKGRAGQVFFLHNRVQSIAAVAQRLARLVPECTLAVGHGQMGARELERVMKAFTHGDVDVLIATTIIESGLDIPAAGTIVIDRADEFGLSELHQLRGRVGRGNAKARCLLLVDRWRPLSQVARERLKALEEMTQLGSGFAISMKDLEIRGAGNILGPEQSGHIAAIGYDMYCRLLKQVSDRIQHGEPAALDPGSHGEERGVELELGLEAYLPAEWIESPQTRLEVLRELSTIAGDRDADEAERGLRDRFGRLPQPASDLVRTFRLRARLEALGVTRLSFQGEAYLMEFDDRIAIERWLAGAAGRVAGGAPELRPLRSGAALLILPRTEREAGRALAWFEGLLR